VQKDADSSRNFRTAEMLRPHRVALSWYRHFILEGGADLWFAALWKTPLTFRRRRDFSALVTLKKQRAR